MPRLYIASCGASWSSAVDIERRFKDGSLVKVFVYADAPAHLLNDENIRRHVGEPDHLIVTPNRADSFTGELVVGALMGEQTHRLGTIQLDGIDCAAWVSGRVS